MAVEVIDKIKPKNGGSFPIVEAIDVEVSEGVRLPEALAAKAAASDLAETAGQVALKANAADVTASVNELQGEIDQIVISASAESVVAPEVAAARVDYNGNTYQTLKARLDADAETQATIDAQYLSDIGNAYDTNINLFDYYGNGFKRGFAVRDTGEIIARSDSWITDYIELSNISTYPYVSLSNMPYKVCFYNASKEFISKASTNIQQASIPANTKYVIIMYISTPPSPKISVIQRKTANYLPFLNYSSVYTGNISNGSVSAENIKSSFAEQFCDLLLSQEITSEWEAGSIDSTTGANSSTSANITVRSNALFLVKGFVLTVADGYSAKLFKYSEASDFEEAFDWFGLSYGGINTCTITKSGIYRAIIRRSDSSYDPPTGTELVYVGSERVNIQQDRTYLNILKDNNIKILKEFPFKYSNCTSQTIEPDGSLVYQTKRMLTPLFMLPKNYTIKFAPYAHVGEYDSEGNFIRRYENRSSYQAESDIYIRFAARNATNTAMDDEGKEELFDLITITDANDIDSGYEYFGEKISFKNYYQYSALGFTANGQDACIYNDLMFAFSSAGDCKVVDVYSKATVSTFSLDQTPTIAPHCNSAVFSSKKYDDSDVFPLLYVNAYNTSGLPLGTVYVHRIITDENGVPTGSTLIQSITIGFTNDEIWSNGSDIRPYGNFFIDTDNNYLYAYTLKDDIRVTRFFKFELPQITESYVELAKTDILDYFDIEYLPYIQGNTYYAGKAYILNGYGTSGNRGKLSVINLESKKLVSQINLYISAGLTWEPEFIDVHNNSLIMGVSAAYRFNF